MNKAINQIEMSKDVSILINLQASRDCMKHRVFEADIVSSYHHNKQEPYFVFHFLYHNARAKTELVPYN